MGKEESHIDDLIADTYGEVEALELDSIGDLDNVLYGDKAVPQATQEVQPVVQEQVQQPVQVPIQEPQPVQSTPEEDADLRELEDFLGIEEEQEVTAEQLEQETDEVDKGNLGVPLYHERQKTRDLKLQNELLSKQIEFMTQQNEFARTQGQITPPTQQIQEVEQTLEDFLPEIGDGESITKGEMLQYFNQMNAAKQQTELKQQQENEALAVTQARETFSKSHGKELGILSYENVSKLVQNQKIPLTEGQWLDVNNAVKLGKNPAEIMYEAAILNRPALSRKRAEQNSLKSLITTTPQKPVIKQVNPIEELSFVNRVEEQGDWNSHLDSLC
jgi:hypothetical protein